MNVKISPDIIKTICDAVERGMPKRHAAALGGISKETLYEWERRGQIAQSLIDAGESVSEYDQECANFALAYCRAEASRIGRLMGDLEQTESGAVVSARTWMLERGFTREFGASSKVALTGADDGPIRHEVNGDALLTRLAALAARSESGNDT